MVCSSVGRAALASTLLASVLMVGGCGVSPWEQDGAGSTTDSEPRSFSADSARLDVWCDERPSGIVINHGKLVLDAPRLGERPVGGRSTVIVTTNGPTLSDKIHDVVEDRIPVSVGMTASFALGKTVTVRIERLEDDGSRTFLEEGRVAFVELVRR
ncbi:MAG: hypothetical protein ACKO0W_11135 [Planctomycetota bacterium]